MIESVRVIGDGGAFDTKKTNSSFFIKTSTKGILYDCGYNVFPELMRLDDEDGAEIIDSIDTIIISHDDDDHMGSVKSLLFYKYFVRKSPPVMIYCPDHMAEMFTSMNSEMKGSVSVHAKIVNVSSIRRLRDRIDARDIRIEEFKGVHHTEAYGIIIRDDVGGVVAISGDTKAQEGFEDRLRKISREGGYSGVSDMLIFHDYSEWDAPSRQVHACKSDYDIEFSGEFKKTAKKYHNNAAFLAGKIFRRVDDEWIDAGGKDA
jgi:ribonuclease BN (tRNA processing enzyme)